MIKMKYEEALWRLKDHFAHHRDNIPTPYLDIAERLTYKAIEKQIPKKPVEGFPRDYKCNECYCTVFTAEHYCGNCGQAIDWSDVK